jgi:hypothetical protein
LFSWTERQSLVKEAESTMKEQRGTGSTVNYELDFKGPYSWHGLYTVVPVFNNPYAKFYGIYLWVVPHPPIEYVYYVGETGRSFADRMREHLMAHLAGFYHLYEPTKLVDGIKVMEWPGLYDPKEPRTLSGLIENYSRLTKTIDELAKLFWFYLAPLNAKTQERKRIEGALARHLYEQQGVVGSFQDKGIRYISRKDSDQPIWVKIVCPERILGMPTELIA